MSGTGGETLSTFTRNTTGAFGYLKNQLASFGLWTNIPGGLSKISTSTAGYVWGFNSSGGVYVCREPCSSASWINIAFSGTPIDIITDPTSVYILSSAGISSAPIDGTGSWTLQTVPFEADKLVTTNGYMWISGNTKMAFCGKPCTTGNWIMNSSQNSLLGGGASSVYATQPGTLGVVKSDETGQTGWTPVGGFEGMGINSMATEADNTAIYGADNSRLYRCADTCDGIDKIGIVDTDGHNPIANKGSISMNATSRNVWMASSASSNGGNIFARLDAPNDAPILNYVDDTLAQNDRLVNSLGDAVHIQTADITTQMVKEEAGAAVKSALNMSGNHNKIDKEIAVLKREIQEATNIGSGYTTKMKPLIILLISLAVAAILYIVVGWLLPATLTMILVIIDLSIGFGLAIYFSVKK